MGWGLHDARTAVECYYRTYWRSTGASLRSKAPSCSSLSSVGTHPCAGGTGKKRHAGSGENAYPDIVSFSRRRMSKRRTFQLSGILQPGLEVLILDRKPDSAQPALCSHAGLHNSAKGCSHMGRSRSLKDTVGGGLHSLSQILLILASLISSPVASPLCPLCSSWRRAAYAMCLPRNVPWRDPASSTSSRGNLAAWTLHEERCLQLSLCPC